MRNNQPKPPVDLRFEKKPSFGRDSCPEVVAGCMSFLENVYQSIAENLPDVRDESWDGILSDEGPSIDLSFAGDASKEPPKTSEHKPKQKKHHRGVEVCAGRSVADGCEEKFLPDGTFKEYWIQYKSQSSSARVASFTTFWRVP